MLKVYQGDLRKERHCGKEGGRGPWFQGQVLWKGNTHVYTHVHTQTQPSFISPIGGTLKVLLLQGFHEAYYINHAQGFSPHLGEGMITDVDI